jgi:hypothetical protein
MSRQIRHSTHAPGQTRPATAQAIAAPAGLFSIRRIGFFPRGPGPGVIVISLIIGVFPSVFVTLSFLNAGVDGGFYLSHDQLLAQHRWLIMIAAVLILAALTALVLVVQSMRKERGSRGPRALIGLLLLATIAWDLLGLNLLRGSMVPLLSRDQVQMRADQGLLGGPFGMLPTTYQGGVVDLHLEVPRAVSPSDMPRATLGPIMCVWYGRLFGGPVDTVRLQMTRADGLSFTSAVSQVECRQWYLQSRTPDRRPRPLLPQSKPGGA